LLRRAGLAPLVSGLPGWLLLAFLLLFSLGEIPVMILAMRYMIGSPSGRWLAALTNAAFTFFAAVYALPFILLTGQVAVGVALAGLSVVRLAAALWFVPGRDRPGSIPQPGPISRDLSHRARNHDLRID
jgi:hypothetical protein